MAYTVYIHSAAFDQDLTVVANNPAQAIEKAQAWAARNLPARVVRWLGYSL